MIGRGQARTCITLTGRIDGEILAPDGDEGCVVPSAPELDGVTEK
jgi:hypothetical protein